MVGGALTVVGGLATVFSGGLASPLLYSGLALGVSGGVSGGLAALAQKLIESDQMKRCQRAIGVDEVSTRDLADYVEAVRIDKTLTNHEGSLVTRAVVTSLVFGDDLAKLFLSSSARVLTGTLTAVLGGVMIPWDLYNLNKGINDLVNGNMSEASKQIRNIADQLEKALNDLQR